MLEARTQSQAEYGHANGHLEMPLLCHQQRKRSPLPLQIAQQLAKKLVTNPPQHQPLRE